MCESLQRFLFARLLSVSMDSDSSLTLFDKFFGSISISVMDTMVLKTFDGHHILERPSKSGEVIPYVF